MGDDFGPLHHADFNPWATPEGDIDLWADPAAEQATLGRQIRRITLGFVLLGLALLLASLDYVVLLATILFDLRPARVAWEQWDFPIETAVVFGSFSGVCLLWGRWPDSNWQRRSGLLLMMCLADVVLWSIDNAVRLGLSTDPFGHEYFRQSLGQMLGWCQFALIASLAADMGTTLGEPRAADMGRAVRSLVLFGLVVWALGFYARTEWRGPFWPLRPRPIQRAMLLQIFGTLFLTAVIIVQVTAICLLAAVVSYRHVRLLDAATKVDDAYLTDHGATWDEWHAHENDRRSR